MKKTLKVILLVSLALIFSLGIYALYEIFVPYDNTIPEFKEYDVSEIRSGTRFEVKKLEFNLGQVTYTDIGKVEGFKFVFKGPHLRYGDEYPVNYTSPNWLNINDMHKVTHKCDLPAFFTENTENAEGIIIFDGVPYSLYYDESGKAFVKCLETRFNDYFKADKPYSDFIRWAKYYTRRLDDEDLLSS